MITHPITECRISPRKLAKFMVREALQDLLVQKTWEAGFPEAYRLMTTLEKGKVQRQMDNLFRSIDRRHRLEEDGRDGTKRLLKRKTPWDVLSFFD